MLRNDEIQAAIISDLKSRSAISAILEEYESSTTEIREDNWKGEQFNYPNIRVRMLPFAPFGDAPATCGDGVNFSASIMVFSESQSSLEADEICGIIADDAHGRSFSELNIQISWRVTIVIPAVADKRTWRSECLVQGIASRST